MKKCPAKCPPNLLAIALSFHIQTGPVTSTRTSIEENFGSTKSVACFSDPEHNTVGRTRYTPSDN